LVPTAKEVGLIQDDVQSISIPAEPSTSKPHKKHKPKKQQTQAPKVPSPEPSPEHRLPLSSNDPLPGVPLPTQQIPHTVSSIKLLILKKRNMKMEHYLSHTDYPIWQVIQNGNGLVSITTYSNGMIKVLPPKTAEEVVAREKEKKARTTLRMALQEDHLEKFYKMADAKEMFQTLLSQLEIYGAGVSHEDANQKFLRSLPSYWSQVALIMRTKPGLDTLRFDDLYNNLRVFKRDVKGRIFTYTDEVIHSFFANQSSAPQLDYDDLKQINDDDME
nr:ribonuclease H-like domain-containing protein [Tanacetum cinerariifolium]